MTRAISAIGKGNPTKDLQDVLRLVDNGTDNPTARAYLRGEAYIIFLMQPNAQGVVPRSSLGLTTNPTGTVDLYAGADSAGASSNAPSVTRAGSVSRPSSLRL